MLGDIVNGQMELSSIGKIVEHEWYRPFDMRNELLLHAIVFMPNHLHTIVEINKTNSECVDNDCIDTKGRSYLYNHLYSYKQLNLNGQKSFPRHHPFKKINKLTNQPLPIRMPQSISSFVAGFKSAVNTNVDNYIDDHQLDIPKFNRNNHFFQPNYHDHIIRNAFEYCRIKKYIDDNPRHWDNVRKA